MLTNPPFTRQPNMPPLHLRDLEPEEMEQWKRMRAAYEQLTRPAMPVADNLEPSGDPQP